MSLPGKIRAGAAYVEVTAETTKLQRNLNNAKAQLQDFGRACNSIGKDLLMVSGAIAVPLGIAVKNFVAFDDQMRLVRAVTKATQEDFESLTKVAQKLGRETSFTAQQVAEGMTGLGRMGFSPKEIEQAIQPTLDLARATGTDLGEAANIAANSMRIFGIEASKMTGVADILTATANGSAQTLQDLFEGLKMAGPQAKAAGESINDTAAALGLLANLGIKGSLAGTALRKSFSQFAKIKVQEQLKQVKVTTVDANGNLRKMADIMADIGKVMTSMPSAEKISFAEDIFDIRGSLAGLSLGGNVKDLEAFIAKLHDVDGTARQTSEEMDAGLGGSFRKLMSAVEGAMNAIAKSLESTLQPIVDRITAVTLEVIKWIEANASLIRTLASVVVGAAALGVTLVAIGVTAKGLAALMALASTGVKTFHIAVKAVLVLKTAFVACMTSWSAATLAFNTANVAGIGICGALKAAIIALLASNPVGWILTIVGAVAGLLIALNALISKTEECSNAMATMLQNNDQARQLDQQRMERLQQLANKQSLSNDEMAEAKKLTGQLEGKYGALGVEINEMAKSVTNLVTAQDALNKAIAQSALDDLNKKIIEHQENIRKATGYNEDLWTGWNGVGRKVLNLGWDYWTVDGSDSKAQKAIKDNQSYITGQQTEIVELQKRKDAIANGVVGSTTGTNPSDDEKTKGNIDAETAKQAVSFRQYLSALESVADMEDKFAAERRTDLENELLEIDKVNKEYKTLLQTMHDFEQAKAPNMQDKVKIAELEKKLQEADKIAAERIKNAEDKAGQRLIKEVANYERNFAKSENDVQTHRNEQAQDRKINDTMNSDKDAGIQMLNDMISQYRQAAIAAKAQFQTELQAAQADGTIDDDERQKLNDANAGYSRAESMLDKYEDKLRDAQDGTQQAADKKQNSGSFFAEALNAMLGHGGTEAERTANATEEIAKRSKDTNKLLKKLDLIGTTLTYG